jgi:hypothetical protein
MTFMLPFLVIPLVGLSIDGSVCRLVQLKLQAAVDGAATGAGRLLGVVTDDVVQNVASEFLKSNFTTGAGSWGAYNLSSVQGTDIVYTPGITKKIFVRARVTQPLLFLRILGFRSVLIASVGQATRTDSRVIFVLDRSGSMNTSDGSGSTVIADALTNAATFIAKFREGIDELGLVVFDGSAAVGYPTYAAGGYTSAICSLGTCTATCTATPSVCGPNTTFQDGTGNDMPHQVAAVQANGGTGMAEALAVAYIELQKAHMRDLANPLNSGVDTRTSTIVLLTDGVPTAASLYLNDPQTIAGVAYQNNIINGSASGNTCTNRHIPPSSPTPTAATMMLSYFAVPGPPFNQTSGSSSPWGMYLLATSDTAHSSYWWMSTPGTTTSPYGDLTTPVTTPYVACTAGLLNQNGSSGVYNYFTKIPPLDRWGHSFAGTAYTNSHITGGSATMIYSGTGLTMTNYKTDSQWLLAMWNSVDNTAASIRLDSNKPNRVGDTDAAMKIGFEVLGYTGNGGVDDGLLKRVANDPGAVGFVAAQPNGRYYSASDPVQLAAAMNAIAGDILRLSR